MFFLWLIGILLVLSGLYLCLIAPARDIPDTSAMDGWLFAHRGLHGESVPENSLAAFTLAVEAGYGMELDVQLTADGQLVVFHDADLNRVCGVDARVMDLTYEELAACPLPDGSPIPLLSQVLEVVGGRTPMIVEIKHYGAPERNAQATLEVLHSYQGAYAVESFHPLAVRYFRRYAPGIIRGQLANGSPWKPGESSRMAHFALKHLLVNAIGRPHFVAYSCPEDHTLAMWLMKKLFQPWLAAWTIRSPEALRVAQEDYEWAIFEGFEPHAGQ